MHKSVNFPNINSPPSLQQNYATPSRPPQNLPPPHLYCTNAKTLPAKANLDDSKRIAIGTSLVTIPDDDFLSLRTHLTSLTINLTKLVEARDRQKSELEREILEKKQKVTEDANKEKELLKNKMKLESTLEKEAKKEIKTLEKNIITLEKDIKKVENDIEKAKKKHLSQLSKENKMITDVARKEQIISSQRQALEEKTKHLEMQIKQKEEIKDLKSQFLQNMTKESPFYLPDPVPCRPKAPILQNPAYHQPSNPKLPTDAYNYLVPPLPPQVPNYNCHNIYNNNNSFGPKLGDRENQALLVNKRSDPLMHESSTKDQNFSLENDPSIYNGEVFRKLRYDFNLAKNVWPEGHKIKDYNVSKNYEMPRNLDPNYDFSKKFYPNVSMQGPNLQKASNYINKPQHCYLSNSHVNQEYEKLNQKYNQLPKTLPSIRDTNSTNNQNYPNNTNNYSNTTFNQPPSYSQHLSRDEQILNLKTHQHSLNITNNQKEDSLPAIPYENAHPDASPSEQHTYDEILPDEYIAPKASDYENAEEENYISHFKLVRMMKKGCFGDVVVVKSRITDNLYVVKTICKKEATVDKICRNKMIFTILAENRHPFVVIFHDFMQNPKQFFFVMEYLPGGSIKEHIKRCRKFDEFETAFYAGCVLLALKHLHSMDIAHRNITLDNIVIDCCGYAKLVGFDYAMPHITHETPIFDKSGKNIYKSPEFFKPCDFVTRACDFWSLGVVIHAMLTAKCIYTKPCLRLEQADLTSEGEDLLVQLLHLVPSQRLGYGPNGGHDIMKHCFFKAIDWVALFRKQLVPPRRFINYCQNMSNEKRDAAIITHTEMLKRKNED